MKHNKVFNAGDKVIMIRTCTWWTQGPPVLKGTVGILEQAGNLYARFTGAIEHFELRNCRKFTEVSLTKLEKVLYEIKEE
jgi:hypothetical protein